MAAHAGYPFCPLCGQEVTPNDDLTSLPDHTIYHAKCYLQRETSPPDGVFIEGERVVWRREGWSVDLSKEGWHDMEFPHRGLDEIPDTLRDLMEES